MPPMPSAMPVGQFGATGPSRMDSRVKVSTPPSEVTKGQARAAGATSAAGRAGPDQDGEQDRAAADPVDAARAAGQGGQADQHGGGDAAGRAGRLGRGLGAGGAGGGPAEAPPPQAG